ncbi:MAG: hypothetical protein EZS28_030838, partial [Streblomastix strix]
MTKTKEPRKPLLLFMLLFGVGTRKLLLGQLMFLLSYLGQNDIRNRITNEIIQGIRIVKFSGLENVFMDRIQKARLAQCYNSAQYTFLVFLINLLTRSFDPLCNTVLLPAYVFNKKIQQIDFPETVMPNLSFLNQMRRECRAIPLHIQSIMMVFIGLDRIEEFLLLEELRLEKHEIPDDPERVAL